MRYTSLILLVLFNCTANAQMQLNNAFGTNGVVKISFADYTEPVSISKLQNNSLMLLANATDRDTVIKTDIVIMKLSADGSTETSFGNNGHVRYDFNGMDVSTADATLRTDNDNILVLGAGYALNAPDYKPACLMQLHSDGTVDSTFATNGTLNVQFAAIEEYPRVLKKSITGQILMGGFSSDTFHAYMDVPAIALVNSNGTLDTTFGIAGRAYLRFPGGVVESTRHLIGGVLYDILALADGTLLAAGGYSNGNNLVGFITHLLSNGQVDSSFFNKGYMAVDFTPYSNSQIIKMIQAPNGVVWFGATSTTLQGRNFYAGSLNLSTQDINTGVIDFNSQEDVLADMQLDAQGNLFLVGKTIKPQHNVDSYRSDQFAVAYVPTATFPFNYQQFTYSEDSTLQTGAAGSVRMDDGSLVCYGFKDEANGKSELMLISISTNNLTTGLENVNNNLLSVYPNPASETVYVSNTGEQIRSVTLSNIAGQTVLSQEVTSNIDKTSVDVSGLAAGLYLLQAKSDTGVSNVKLVIK